MTTIEGTTEFNGSYGMCFAEWVATVGSNGKVQSLDIIGCGSLLSRDDMMMNDRFVDTCNEYVRGQLTAQGLL